ncbi:MAG TPA: copper resistance protein CopC [Gaiellaceae bacterium]|nr:copper resistance protein CopC [Gaiellaceae bacterium]
MKRLFALGAVAALLFPAVAWAHATLESTTPSFQSDLAASPKTIELHFDQEVKFPVLDVFDVHGKNYASSARAAQTNVIATLRKLPTGDYTVRWHALSADSHVVSGVWTFGVRMRALPPTEAYGASGPTQTENVVRWLYFLALALVIGSLGFRLICLRGLQLPPKLEQRLYALTGIGVAGVIEIGILAFCLRCEDVLQLPFVKFLYGDLSPFADETRFGEAFVIMTLGFALISALVFLSWLLDRTPFLAVAFVASIALDSGISLSGHDAIDPGSSWKTEIADWLHLSAASLWIGGLVSLIVVWRAAAELRREVFARFSRFATMLVAVILSAGIYLSIVRLPHLADLWTQGYGQVLLVKLSLVAVVLAWGAAHQFLVKPALAGASDGFLTRVGRSLVGESAVAIAVLLVAAILTDSKPPPRPAGSAVVQASAVTAGP